MKIRNYFGNFVQLLITINLKFATFIQEEEYISKDMDNDNTKHCGPCGYDYVNKEARRWCTNCEDGLCEYCEKVLI